ncbi:MAG: mechanosensitive ion channel family protein [Oceanipulchritudo sp.]
MEVWRTFLPLVLTLVLVLALLWTANWLLLGRRPDLGNEKKIFRQLLMILLTLLGIVAVAVALPVEESTRNQVIAFIGLVVSGILAFSSTTIFANLMAGVMMRITRPFRAGDFVKVREFFGRVSERGLLDTEIQTETRELIAIPNTYLITNPVSVIRSSGTIVSASLSLGYDVHHSRIEPLLVEAAQASGLEDPYVHITEIGNFAVTYRINGMLRDVKSLLTARSSLLRAVLDTLHREEIEIVSPTFMNQRQLGADRLFVPPPLVATSPESPTQAEQMVFDKAEEAEKRELERLRLEKEIEELEKSLKEAGEELKSGLEERLRLKKAQLESLDNPPEPGRFGP